MTPSDNPLPRVFHLTVKKDSIEPGTITVYKGERIKLILSSVDATHEFEFKDFGIELKIIQGKTESIEIMPEKEGEIMIVCSPSCRPNHTAMEGEIRVVSPPDYQPTNLKVDFDSTNPGVVYVESNGQRIRIDTNTKDYARVATTDTNSNTATAAVASGQEKPARKSEPYDYQLINVPTPKRVPKGSFNVHFSHRFSSTITGQGQDFEDVASELFGLDSSSVSALGFTFGFTDRLYGKLLRSPVCDSAALCKTIEMGVGYHLLDEAGKSPLALSLYGSIEGNDNFTENFSYNLQALMGRSITDRFHLFFSPAVHFKTNGYGRFNPRPGRFFNDEQIARDFRLGQHTGSFGIGVNAKVTEKTSLLFEYVPRTGFKLGRVEPVFDSDFNLIGYENRSFPSIGFGIEKRLGRHAFSLTFSNSQTTTTSRYNSSNINLPRDRFVIGFNLFRRLF